MSHEIVDLDGPDWLVREALGLTWQWYAGASLPGDVAANNVADAAGQAARTPGWLPAVVPGSVITDLWRAGELPDPYVGRNSRAAEWVATRSWVYRRTVDLPPLDRGERAVLELDGVDPGATVVWDGQVVGRVDGLYHRARIDLTPHLGTDDPRPAGRHRLALVVHPAPDSQPQVGRTELVRVHAPRMTYGWDFCPRMIHQGVWRSARVVVGAVQLAEVSARTELLPGGADVGPIGVRHTAVGPTAVGPTAVEPSGVVRVAAVVEADRPVQVEALLRDPAGAVVATTVVPATAGGATLLDLEVADPARWWPHGYGDQPLYRLEVRAATATWVRDVGFRDVVMVPNPGGPVDALPYTAVVNGRPVELLGWNWVPADAQYGTVRAERVEHLVDLAVRTGACVLRIWGGGLVETEELYAACDRRGLLVWQELSQSSSGMQSAPATDDAFVAMMRDQARAVVPPRTHHPSLLMWGGGNELDLDGVPLDEDRSPVLAALREEIARLDPGRHWVATSPTGPVFHNRLDVIETVPDRLHDVHGPWEHQGLAGHPALYDAGTCLAHTEFGVEGMTNLRTLRALVPAEQRWPTGRDNPVYRHLGEWWNNETLVQDCFGGRLTDVEQVLRASQLLQATGLAYAVEADRRRAPRCSMVLPWQLGESYPNAWCTSAVDHRGDAKPVLHAVRRAFAADRVTLRAPTTAWAGREHVVGQAVVWSRDGVAAGSRVAMRLRTEHGTVVAERAWTVGEPVREPVEVGTLEVPVRTLPRDAVLVWDLEWVAEDGTPLDHELVLATTATDLAPLLDLDPAELAVEVAAVAPDRWRVHVRHVAGPVVVGLEVTDGREITAPGWAVPDGDPRPLLPGAERWFDVRWRDDVHAVHPAEPPDLTGPCHPVPRLLELTAWNIPGEECGWGQPVAGGAAVEPRARIRVSRTTWTGS